MASRRRGKEARTIFGDEPELTMQEAADLVFGDFGDAEVLDDVERNRVITRPVLPSELKIDPAIQVRIKPNPERVEELKQVLLNGGKFKDPIRAFRDDEGNLWLSAGFRRTEATDLALAEAKRLAEQDGVIIEIAPLICVIHPGGRDGALNDAEDDNLKHGEPLTVEDKRGVFQRRLARGHEWFSDGWSNRRIAAELMVSEGAIRKWLASFSPSLRTRAQSGENEGKLPPSKIITKDGREMDTSRIGQAQKRSAAHKNKSAQPAAPSPAAEPDRPQVSQDEIARAITSALAGGDLVWHELLRTVLENLEATTDDVKPFAFNRALKTLLDTGQVVTSQHDQAAFALPSAVTETPMMDGSSGIGRTDFSWSGSEASVLSALLQDLFGLNRLELEDNCARMGQKAADKLRREIRDVVLLLQQWEGWLA